MYRRPHAVKEGQQAADPTGQVLEEKARPEWEYVKNAEWEQRVGPAWQRMSVYVHRLAQGARESMYHAYGTGDDRPAFHVQQWSFVRPNDISRTVKTQNHQQDQRHQRDGVPQNGITTMPRRRRAAAVTSADVENRKICTCTCNAP